MPEIIQSLWIGRPLSLIEQLSITSFLKNGHEFHLYCYDEIKNVPTGAKILDATNILPASEIFCYQTKKGRGSVSAFSNVFRYKLLLEKGGWWSDADVVCLRPLNFHEPAVIATEAIRRGGQRAATALMKLPPGHEIARTCYTVATQKDRAKLQWGEIGPELLDRVVREKHFSSLTKPPDLFCPLPYWEWKKLLQPAGKSAQLIFSPEARTVHLWHELWRRADIDLNPERKKSTWERIRCAFKKLGPRRNLDLRNSNSPFAALLERYQLR